jgi:hypothetical protein
VARGGDERVVRAGHAPVEPVGRYVQSVVPTTGKIRIYLNQKVTSKT